MVPATTPLQNGSPAVMSSEQVKLTDPPTGTVAVTVSFTLFRLAGETGRVNTSRHVGPGSAVLMTNGPASTTSPATFPETALTAKL